MTTATTHRRHSVPDVMKQVLTGQIKDPRLAELTMHFIALNGGMKGFAKMLHDEYQSAPQGGVVRARILDMILRVWKDADSKQSARDNLGLLSVEDLERELEATLGEFMPEEEEAKSD